MLLAKLLRTLSEEEIAKIRKDFRLPERSKLLFERIALSANTPPDSRSLAKAFRISSENLYRLFSEIIDECVHILAPKAEYSTMKFFRSKYLYRPFVTEAMRTEKRLLHEGDKKILEKFYEYVLLSTIEFPIDLIDIDLTEEFGNKWHQSKDHPPIDDDLYIRVLIIYIQVCALPIKKKMTLAQMSARARALLKPIAEQASSSPNPLARHYYYQSEWKSCIYGQVEGMKKIAWLQLSLKTIRGSLSLFPAESAQAMELLIAFELATSCDKAEEGLEIYRKYYHGQTPETSRGALYLMRFCRVAFLARDFVTSRKMVEEFGRYQIVRTTPTIYITVLLAQALLEISEGDPDAASQTLEIAKASNQENFFLAYEVQIRALETAIALKRTDLALADQLVERNIKWLRSRKISLSESAWIYFYQIIAGIIQFKITGATIRTSLIGHFTNNFRSEHPEFFILLESEIAEVSGKET